MWGVCIEITVGVWIRFIWQTQDCLLCLFAVHCNIIVIYIFIHIYPVHKALLFFVPSVALDPYSCLLSPSVALDPYSCLLSPSVALDPYSCFISPSVALDPYSCFLSPSVALDPYSCAVFGLPLRPQTTRLCALFFRGLHPVSQQNTWNRRQTDIDYTTKYCIRMLISW